MAIHKVTYEQLQADLGSHHVTLVAVSKTKSVQEIKELYDLGHRDFGENYEQELVEKHLQLPQDIRWHFIGHLQSNKVKRVAPFIHLIQSVDSFKLLKEIHKQARRNNRVIDCLIQIHIADEQTKFGLDEKELDTLVNTNVNELRELNNARVCGLMGMASFTDDMDKVRAEFQYLKSLFDRCRTRTSEFNILSMGMSADYSIAVEEGSTMVRIGSLIFGERK
ncbi:MAG TPA: YggS family pyridoxal phosphate-dependent enzyme [Chitinophagaceae bacterium]|nr:YggS family pyridoxal phosphate-dependent enzyme [Chitinophagaceae bacterium]